MLTFLNLFLDFTIASNFHHCILKFIRIVPQATYDDNDDTADSIVVHRRVFHPTNT